MNRTTNNQDVISSKPLNSDKYPSGSWVIDDCGNEIPVTEDMIQRACQQLNEQSFYPDFHKSDDTEPLYKIIRRA